MSRVCFALVFCSLFASPTFAQDPVKVDPKHYSVVLDQPDFRVLRVTYGPKEKSVPHDHPASIAVLLTDAMFRFTLPDGKTEEIKAKRGDVIAPPAGNHTPENLTDQPAEVIVVELKKASK